MTPSVSCIQRPLGRHSGENSCSSLSKHTTLASACLGFEAVCPVLYDLQLFAFVPENESYIQMPSWLRFPSSHMPFTTLIIAFPPSCHERGVKNSTPCCDWSFIAMLNCQTSFLCGKKKHFLPINIYLIFPEQVCTCMQTDGKMLFCKKSKRSMK